ncbi:hypothetical protein BFP70_17850 [Thioclava sp. SK-1]|nr:hypothetical protein BFP70_17850 [Thioclava sp. SK-1]
MFTFRSFFLMFVLLASSAGAQVVQGRARIVDGDTLELRGQMVRLHGIDAPETTQTCRTAAGAQWDCGHAATAHLRRLTAGDIRCNGDQHDRYGRLVAKCFRGQTDLGAQMVSDGFAFAYRAYALDYVAQEKQALVAGRGIWAGDVQNPADWRRTGAVPAAAQASGCVIKGNISGKGKIYHMPGTRSYGVTKISPDKGERWFCTEAQARAAGWRVRN